MLQNQDVIAGKFYVNNDRRIAREVLRTSRQTVTFNTYHLDTGNSCGSPSECLVEDFMRWANGEASSTELAFLQHQSMDA
ncbi:MAG TPA: hypothetical protein VK249_28675 [Anaerolineales bacterium]|nr:hypothetical protein [Anaerolineales bacterium]